MPLKPFCLVLQGFSPGTYQLYACALDTMGARACQTASITVNPPAAVTQTEVNNAVSQVTAINIGQLKATGKDDPDHLSRHYCCAIANFIMLGRLCSGALQCCWRGAHFW